jgi:gamma-glutamylcyclotransferase (GGCT)/AIG2-like uncharacterized protein YtfP
MAQRLTGKTFVGNSTENDTCQRLLDRVSDRTPDFLELRNIHTIPVLVYGTLKMGGIFHDALRGAPYLGEATTIHDGFFMKETSSFPVAFFLGNAGDQRMKHKGKLHGEVYVVDPKMMLRLDEIEDNGRMYTRRQVMVRLVDQPSDVEVKQKFIKAWVYCGVDRFWSSQEDSLYSVTAKSSSNGRVWDWEPRRPQRGGSSRYIAEAYGPDQRLDDQIPF